MSEPGAEGSPNALIAFMGDHTIVACRFEMAVQGALCPVGAAIVNKNEFHLSVVAQQLLHLRQTLAQLRYSGFLIPNWNDHRDRGFVAFRHQ